MKLTCPSCGAEYPIEAGLLEDDGKRLAAILGEMEPSLARASLAYLRLFKPAKTALRTTRAIAILSELLALVRLGTICRDERSGIRRPASIAAWVAGIEQMVQQPGRLALPLSNHNYLRQVVWGIADQSDARDERSREQQLKSQPRSSTSDSRESPLEKLENHLAWLKTQVDRQFISQDNYDSQVAASKASYDKRDVK